jgi:SNF2 family DNA or RNA helicase
MLVFLLVIAQVILCSPLSYKSYLKTKLDDYQVEGVEWLLKRRNEKGSILADDMGLGKSLQSIAYVAEIIGNPEYNVDGAIVIACPAKVVEHWDSEIKKFVNLKLDVLKVRKGSDLKKDDGKDKKIIILSHTALYLADKHFSQRKIDTLIMDEAQILANEKTKLFNIVLNSLSPKYSIGLTGTPLMNSVNDLINILRALCGFSYPLIHNDIVPRDYFEYLPNEIEPFILRRTKEETLELPEKTVEYIRLDFDADHREIYKAATLIELKKVCDKSGPQQRIKIERLNHALQLASCPFNLNVEFSRVLKEYLDGKIDVRTAAEQIISSADLDDETMGDVNDTSENEMVEELILEGTSYPRYDNGKEFELEDRVNNNLNDKLFNELKDTFYKSRKSMEEKGNPFALYSSAKIDKIVQIINERVAQGFQHPLIIFSRSSQIFPDLQKQLFHGTGVSVHYLDGTSSNTAKNNILADFEKGKIKVLILSLKAFNSGLNLMMADTIVFLDPWWNPQIEKQAEDRIYRRNQDKPVYIIRLIMKDSLEEYVLLLQKTKILFFDYFVGKKYTFEEAYGIYSTLLVEIEENSSSILKQLDAMRQEKRKAITPRNRVKRMKHEQFNNGGQFPNSFQNDFNIMGNSMHQMRQSPPKPLQYPNVFITNYVQHQSLYNAENNWMTHPLHFRFGDRIYNPVRLQAGVNMNDLNRDYMGNYYNEIVPSLEFNFPQLESAIAPVHEGIFSNYDTLGIKHHDYSGIKHHDTLGINHHDYSGIKHHDTLGINHYDTLGINHGIFNEEQLVNVDEFFKTFAQL